MRSSGSWHARLYFKHISIKVRCFFFSGFIIGWHGYQADRSFSFTYLLLELVSTMIGLCLILRLEIVGLCVQRGISTEDVGRWYRQRAVAMSIGRLFGPYNCSPYSYCYMLYVTGDGCRQGFGEEKNKLKYEKKRKKIQCQYHIGFSMVCWGTMKSYFWFWYTCGGLSWATEAYWQEGSR